MLDILSSDYWHGNTGIQYRYYSFQYKVLISLISVQFVPNSASLS